MIVEMILKSEISDMKQYRVIDFTFTLTENSLLKIIIDNCKGAKCR